MLSDKTTFYYKDESENFDILILLSRKYDIDWLNSIGSECSSMTNEELLGEICLSGCVHDELIDHQDLIDSELYYFL